MKKSPSIGCDDEIRVALIMNNFSPVNSSKIICICAEQTLGVLNQVPMIPFDVATFEGKEYAVTPLPILTLTELTWNS